MRPSITALVLVATPLAVWLRPTVSTTKVVETRTHVITVPEPIVLRFQQPPPSVEPPSCPPPRKDAPVISPPELPEPVTHVVTSSTNAGWIAAYNDEHVYVSTDAGKTFDRVLDAENDEQVFDVGFDCFGNTIVVREGRVGVRDFTTETWRILPGIDLNGEGGGDGWAPPLVKVIGGGPHVAIFGRTEHVKARVAISRDLGATWGYHELHEYFEGPTFGARQLPDGSIDIALEITDCDSYQVQWSRIRDGSIERSIARAEPTSNLAFEGDRLFSEDHWRTWTSPVTYEGWNPVRGKMRRPRDPRIDPAGREWTIHCGQLRIATREKPPACNE